MGSLVRLVTSVGAIGYGVNVFEQLPPGRIAAAGLSTVGMVADLPWGPTNTITTINSPGEFFDTFCPAAFESADEYVALRALLNKTLPGGFLVCRIAATSQATAARTYQDDDPADSVTVTAKYPGALGNLIYVEWAANADDATARDAIVTIGTGYSVRYPNVATIVSAALVVTDPGDPYCTFSKHASGNEVPVAAAAAALTGGADGTATAANHVGTSSSNVGIRKFYGDAVDVDVLFVAECPSALIDAVNTGLKAFATETDKGMVILCTPNGLTRATAITYAAGYRDDRCVMVWPRPNTVNGFDPDQAVIEVDGNAFMAALLGVTDPWISPGGRHSADFLKGIVSLEDESVTATGYDQLNAAGIAPLRMVTAYGGACISKAVTTSLTSGLTKIRRRRYTDYLSLSIADRMQDYVERPLDLDLSTQTLGPETGSLKGEIDAFVAAEVQAKHLAPGSRADAWSAATQDDIDAGRWTIAILARTYSDMDEIVLKPSVGDSVNVDRT
jgi:hypothetical protein